MSQRFFQTFWDQHKVGFRISQGNWDFKANFPDKLDVYFFGKHNQAGLNMSSFASRNSIQSIFVPIFFTIFSLFLAKCSQTHCKTKIFLTMIFDSDSFFSTKQHFCWSTKLFSRLGISEFWMQNNIFKNVFWAKFQAFKPKCPLKLAFRIFQTVQFRPFFGVCWQHFQRL